MIKRYHTFNKVNGSSGSDAKATERHRGRRRDATLETRREKRNKKVWGSFIEKKRKRKRTDEGEGETGRGGVERERRIKSLYMSEEPAARSTFT